MTYQVLARKWRPKTFVELAGQEHVVQALTNALAQGRLHHAYLLTGTRGVGKTTIARILAKSLNCITGVTPTPCGVCPACLDIDGGRFVDLLELDAASNTGIDNMREILDNARYAPTVGRYKVYLIDEVHMLSKAAFNSMLKTLEEPPEHVKFVLATTDPQKIPVTVLSRCLQFNLKQLPQPIISRRLAEILEAESLSFEAPALSLLARAAQGSMRDALSLLDQAIAYGGGEVREEIVRNMLGAIDTEYIYRLTDALLARDGAALLAEADAMAERTLSFPNALEELAALFHRLAIAQTVPSAVETMDDREKIVALAQKMTPESVQLAYQICVQGRADLALAPDEATGFSMTLLRLLAFEPSMDADNAQAAGNVPLAPTIVGSGTTLATSGNNASASSSSNAGIRAATGSKLSAASGASSRAPTGAVFEAGVEAPRTAGEATLTPREGMGYAPLAIDAAEWPRRVAGLKLTGLTGQLAAQSELRRCTEHELTLGVPETLRHLTDKMYVDKLRAALERSFERKLRLTLEVGAVAAPTLAAQEKRERAEAQAVTEAKFRDDPFVRDVVARFDATVNAASIAPVSK